MGMADGSWTGMIKDGYCVEDLGTYFHEGSCACDVKFEMREHQSVAPAPDNIIIVSFSGSLHFNFNPPLILLYILVPIPYLARKIVSFECTLQLKCDKLVRNNTHP